MGIKKSDKFMGSVTVGEKGQIVIPKAIRDMFGIAPGDTLLILASKDRGIAIPPPETSDAVERMIFDNEGENGNG